MKVAFFGGGLLSNEVETLGRSSATFKINDRLPRTVESFKSFFLTNDNYIYSFPIP